MPCASQIHYPSFHSYDQLCLKHHLCNDLFNFHLNCFVCCWAFVVEVASHFISCPIMISKLKQLPLFFWIWGFRPFLLWNFHLSLGSCFLLFWGGLEGHPSTTLALEVNSLAFEAFLDNHILFYVDINNSLLKIQIGSMVVRLLPILFPRIRNL